MNRQIAPGLLLLLAACSSSGDADDSGNQPAPVALVSLGRATPGSVQQSLTIYGSVQRDSSSQYALSTPVEATVVAVPRPVGSAVTAGEVVARLAPSPNSRAAMTRAGSDAQAAAQAYARAQRLRADGLASNADVEAARSAAVAAQAQQVAMRQSARSLTLTARTAGFVEAVPVNPGDLLAAGSTVATLSRAGTQRAGFGIDPADAAQLRPGMPLAIAIDGGQRTVTVPIASIDTSVNPQTRLATIYARVPAGLHVGPGQPLTAQVPLRTSNGGLSVPYAALLDDGGQPYVYVVAHGVAHRHDVTTGPANGQRVVIVRGVSAGDAVVTAGGTALEDGMKVRTR